MRIRSKTLVAAALLAASCGASANIVDLFSAPPPPAAQQVQIGAGLNTPASQYCNGDGSIIDSCRDLALSATGTSPVLRSTLAIFDERLIFSNDDGVTGLGIVQWDGGAGAIGSLDFGLDADLTDQAGCPASGCSFFQTSIFFADADIVIQFGVFTDADTFSFLSFTTQGVNNPSGAPLTLQFDWFNTAGTTEVQPGFFVTVVHGSGGAADFTDVGAIELQLNTQGRIAADLTMGALQKNGVVASVPEPGALVLASIALLAAAYAGRRRRSVHR